MYETGLNGLRLTGIWWKVSELVSWPIIRHEWTLCMVSISCWAKVLTWYGFFVRNMGFGELPMPGRQWEIILMQEVASLYGKKKKPQPEDLSGIDVMIFDMQDVGVRFYTYLSTLHYVMEACAEQDIPLIVMDRPNPNAFYVDGPVLQKEFKSFVGMHPVPVVYGMTIGEYAGMINGEGWLKDNVICNLTVISCEGWKREQPVTLPYAPSPNLPDSVSIILYPSTCFFEGTVINEGRGTLHPFQVFGHPSLKGMPYSYVPRPIKGMSMQPKCKGQTCYGMDLRGEYYTILKMKRLNLAWLLQAYQEYKGKEPFFNALFNKLVGNDKVQRQLKEGATEEEIRAGWQDEVAGFMKVRERYLIYD